MFVVDKTLRVSTEHGSGFTLAADRAELALDESTGHCESVG